MKTQEQEFEDWISDSEESVRLSKKRGDDWDSILSGLYNDPSHFIYELIQNAEGWAEAKEITFELSNDKLDIYYSGIDFKLDDIKRVTGIGQSKGKDDLNKIGKFGIGFKSVFAITQTPFIHSGEYNIQIKDFIVPSVVENVNKSGTKITLPFNHKSRSKEEVFNLISKKLENIGLKTLLFLQNIKEIKWKTPYANGHYLKESDEIPRAKNTKRVTIISDKNTEEYLIIERPIKIDDFELKVEVAYKIGKDEQGKETIIPEPDDSKLVVFFPTDRITFLNFLIQGPYRTTPNRENIPLDDEQNKYIIEETGNLVAESISIIKQLGYLTIDFLNLLPIVDGHKEEQIYPVMYKKVREKLLSDEKLLPTADGKFAQASDVLLADGKQLTELLNQDDIQCLFSKKHWLDTNITEAKTKALRSYLMDELKVNEVNFESFARKISIEFLQPKSDEWMIDFYSRLLDQQALWREKSGWQDAGILRSKPFIRLENNEHIIPFDSAGNPLVYLPSKTQSKLKNVKHAITQNKEAINFLQALGLTEPDLFSEIREFILPKYQNNEIVTDDENY